MFKALAIVCLLLLCAAQSSCAPPGVPFGATVRWGLKSDFYWTWTWHLERGCVAWSAKERYASVLLLVDSRCEGKRVLSYAPSSGISYLTFADEVVFLRYWPEGESYGGNPCPHSISEAQIAELRSLTSDALERATTEAQRRVLRRIDERLSVVNGGALMSTHGGWCSDLTQQDWDPGPERARADAWRADR